MVVSCCFRAGLALQPYGGRRVGREQLDERPVLVGERAPPALVVDGDGAHRRAAVALERDHDGRLRLRAADLVVEGRVAPAVALGIARDQTLLLRMAQPERAPRRRGTARASSSSRARSSMRYIAPVLLDRAATAPRASHARILAQHHEQLLERRWPAPSRARGRTGASGRGREQLLCAGAAGCSSCVTDMNRRKKSMLTVAWVDSAARVSASSSLVAALCYTPGHADGPAQVFFMGAARMDRRAVAQQQVPVGQEARVLVGVAHVQRPGDVARDSRAPTFTRMERTSLPRARDTSSSFAFAEQVQRGAVGLEGLGDLVEDELEQLVEIERRPERGAHLAQRLADAHLARERGLRLGEAQIERARRVGRRGRR